MASISYKEIEEKLKKLKDQPVDAPAIGFALLKAFGMTDTSVERVRSGKMNMAHFCYRKDSFTSDEEHMERLFNYAKK
jgi:hypothetical protein